MGAVLALLIYFLAGAILYGWKYPAGLFAREDDPELERLRRTSRRRIRPFPDPGERR